MKWQYTALIAAFVICLAGGLIWSANHYHSKSESEKARADKAEERAESSEVVTGNVIQSVRIMNSISKANQDAKNQIALDAQRAQGDIKMAVKGDVCADKPIPSRGVNRLREYANSLRTCTDGTDSGKSHC